MSKWYAVILGDSKDVTEVLKAENPEQAVEEFLATLPDADAAYHRENGIYALEAERVTGHRIPGYMLSVLEYGPEFAGLEPGSDEYREYESYAKALEGLEILGWVRVDSTFDLWSPVTK